MKKRNKGITLIALVITIIVLLILAGITITTLTGDNGILSKANNASEETKKKEYEEILKVIANGLKIDKIVNNWNNKKYLDELEKEIPKEEKFAGSEINRKNDETINVVTKEKYVYKITENEIKYVGTQGKNPPPNLQESDITFTIVPKDKYTNEDVTVEIIANIEIGKNILQYSTDGNNWTNYEKPILVGQNGLIFARLINELDEVSGNATKNITNIDKEIPNDATISFSPNEILEGETITATVSQSDNLSGVDIEKCKWILTTSNSPIGTEDISQYSEGEFNKEIEDKIILSGKKEGTYYLHVLTIDKAGNMKETISSQGITVKAPLYIIQNGVLKNSNYTLAGDGAKLTQESGFVKFIAAESGRSWYSWGVSWYIENGQKYNKIFCKLSSPGPTGGEQSGLSLRAGTTPVRKTNNNSGYADASFGSVELYRNDAPAFGPRNFTLNMTGAKNPLNVVFQFYYRVDGSVGDPVHIYELYLE